MSNASQFSRKTLASAVALFLTMPLGIVNAESEQQEPTLESILSTPLPEDATALLDRLNEASQYTEGISQQVLGTQEEIDRLTQQKDEGEARLQDLAAQGETAQQDLEQSRSKLNKISEAKYRGSIVDPVSAVFGAEDPQSAIDRTSYMNGLNQRSQKDVEDLTGNLEYLADNQQELLQTKAANDYHIDRLADLQQDLNHQLDDLKVLQDHIMSAVDNLPMDQKQLWIDKNGPIKTDPDAFLGKATGAVAAALSKLGSPYSWGATGPDSFDCSGLMLWAYQQNGKSIPRTSQAQLSGGTPVSMDALQPGDIIGYYPGVTHVGMYIGDGQIVHASDYGIPVQVVAVNSMPAQGAVRY